MYASRDLPEGNTLLLPAAKNRYACVFYATNDFYAVAVLVAVRRLKELGIESDIDVIALHCRVSTYILKAMNKLGIHTVLASPPMCSTIRYYRDSLLKLRIFQLTQYERIVSLDADALPLTNLSLLFNMKYNGLIGMPRAYWRPALWATSALMVAHPSVDSWNRLLAWLADRAARGPDIPGDMNTLNLAFHSDIQYLPAEYLRLNVDWGDRNFVPAYGDPEDELERTQVIHFSDLGKPWFYHPRIVRRLRPNARQRYYEFWNSWWTKTKSAKPAPCPSDLGTRS